MRWILFMTLMISGSLGPGTVETMEYDAAQPSDVSGPAVAVQQQAEGAARLLPAADTEARATAFDVSDEAESEAGKPATGTGEMTLSAVNGISLYDDREGVIRKLGKPDAVERDEWLPELDIYQYPGMQIGFAEQFIQYVDIDISEGLVIDDIVLEASVDALKAAFGEPDYIAEDGLVFQRGEAVFKLFLDDATGRPVYASYYHIASE